MRFRHNVNVHIKFGLVCASFGQHCGAMFGCGFFGVVFEVVVRRSVQGLVQHAASRIRWFDAVWWARRVFARVLL